MKYYVAYHFQWPPCYLYKQSMCTYYYYCFLIIIQEYNKENMKTGVIKIWNKLLCSSGEKLSKNILNTNLEVAIRYPVSSEVDILDHWWQRKKQEKAHVIMKEAKNYKLIQYQFMEAMQEQRTTINNSTLH